MVTKVEDVTWALDNGLVKVYPNPVQDHLFIENTSDENITVTIYDMGGRALESFEMSAGKERFNASLLSSGQYIIHLNSVKGSWSKKLMFVK